MSSDGDTESVINLEMEGNFVMSTSPEKRGASSSNYFAEHELESKESLTDQDVLVLKDVLQRTRSLLSFEREKNSLADTFESKEKSLLQAGSAQSDSNLSRPLFLLSPFSMIKK